MADGKPVIRSVVYDGQTLTIEWDRSPPYTWGGELFGYQVQIGGVQPFLTGLETMCAVPLPLEVATGAVTVTAVGALKPSQPSDPVPIPTARLVISAVSVDGQSISVQCRAVGAGANAMIVAEILAGDSVWQRKSVPASTSTITFAPPPDPTVSGYFIRGHIESGVARGPDGPTIPLLLTPPVVTFGAVVGDSLTLQWAPPTAAAGVTGYTVTVTNPGGQVTASTSTNETEVNLPLPGGATAVGKATIRAFAPSSTGPSASLSIGPAVAVLSGGYDGATLSLALPTTPPSAKPNLLWVDVLLNGAVFTRTVVNGWPTKPVAVSVTVIPGAAAGVRVTGVGGAALTISSGVTPIPTTRPDRIAAVYDGAELHVSWQPVEDPGISGYLVTVAGTTHPVAPVRVPGASTAETTISADFVLPPGPSATVSVQAAVFLQSLNLTGPASPFVPISLAGYERAVAVPNVSQPVPYLYRSGVYQTLAAVSAANCIAFLPNPFTGANNPTVPPGQNQLFQLQPAPAGSALPYQLVIDKSIWTSFGADAVRPTVRAAYRNFLAVVEQTGVTPWAIRLLRQIIAAAIPQTFAETVYYRYGVWRDDTLRVVDLEPGLRLQVDGALYQLVTGGRDDANGFIASGAEVYDLAEAVPSNFAAKTPSGPPVRMLTVDAFLSQLFPGAGQALAAVAAGPIDFVRPDNRQVYYRLFYPAQFVPSGGTGSTQLTDNIAMVGAPSWKLLEDATDQYAQTGFLPPSGNYFMAYFRGRAALSPLLNVTLNGQPRWTPVGTTVRQLLASIGLPVWPGPGGGAVRLERSVSGLFDHPFLSDSLRFEPVDLSDPIVTGSEPVLWPLDLPVLAGDCLTFAPDSSRMA